MIKRAISIVKRSVSDFSDDNAMSLGAALAFYSALSFAPLLMLLIWTTSFLGEGSRQQVVGQIQGVLGQQAGNSVQMVISNAQSQPSAGTLAGIFGILTILFSASGVFVQLQTSLNRIWDVEAKPGQGAREWVRKRLLSFGMVMAIAFLLVVSLVVSAAIGMIVPGNGILWQAVSAIVSFLIFVGLFAAMYRYVPDVRIPWHDVWVGALITAFLFAVGKFGIGLYLGHSSIGSSYGAAGSLIVLLVWVYYSSLIFFFGAEVTQAYAEETGSEIEPDRHARWAKARPAKHSRRQDALRKPPSKPGARAGGTG